MLFDSPFFPKNMRPEWLFVIAGNNVPFRWTAIPDLDISDKASFDVSVPDHAVTSIINLRKKAKNKENLALAAAMHQNAKSRNKPGQNA